MKLPKISLPTNITKATASVLKGASKNAPLLLTIGGIVLGGACVYQSLKAKDVWNKDMDDIRSRQQTMKENAEALQNGDTDYVHVEVEPVTTKEIIKTVASDLALPVVLGAGSIACFCLSYGIQAKRINGLSAALTSALAETAYYRKKMEAQVGKEKADEFYNDAEEVKETTEDGKTKVTHTFQRKQSMNYRYFDESSECAHDCGSESAIEEAHNYNMTFIRHANDKVMARLATRGYVTMNELYDIFGFSRTKAGAYLGWTEGTFFGVDTQEFGEIDPKTGLRVPHICIYWATPQNILDDIEYTGRYSFDGQI